MVGIGLLVGSAALTETTLPAHGSTAALPAPIVAAPTASFGAGLVWTSDRLAAGVPGAVARLAGVSSAVPVVGATVWLTGSRSATGAPVDTVPAGEGIPLDVRAADLIAYAALVPDADRATFTGLGPDEVLLGATSARLRRLGPGGSLTLAGRTLHVAGVVPDAEVGSAEVFTSSATAAQLGVTSQRYLLVQPAAGATWGQLASPIRAALAGIKPGVQGPGSILGPDDSVLPQVLEKQYFGEFAVQLRAGVGSWLTLDPSWAAAHLRTESVPILGRVTCNSAMLPALRSALADVVAQSLSSMINPNDYGGCFAARLVAGPTTGDISHHAFGSAIDLNVATNPEGTAGHQDPRLVAIFKAHGFAWGGDFLSPDPMHFELDPAVAPAPRA
ncbi:MAG TPA: M15 family metallopeptidase [Sporichthyaceae bacterium]|jgi:hypothetical protein|nr:M15 family metallopeptidase [Sporichthyaceae bacterium]